jgi:uncharacterized protein YbjT (DUF2867 family)
MSSRPSQNSKPVALILGGTGQLGTLVARALQKIKDKTVAIRVTTRRKEEIDELKQQYDDCVYMDFDDPSTYDEAFRGVQTVFLLTGYTFHMVRQAKAIVDQCKKSGVKFIIHNGVYTPEPSYVPYFAWHELIEAYIKVSGIPYAFLHPNYFLHNLIGVYHLVHEGKVNCYFQDRKIGCIALEDVAEAAANIINQGPEKHKNKDYWFSTESLNVYDISKTLTEVCGKKFEAVPKTPKDYEREITENGTKKDIDPYFLSAIEFNQQIVDGRLSFCAEERDDLPNLIGRKGMRLREWASIHKDDLLKA